MLEYVKSEVTRIEFQALPLTSLVFVDEIHVSSNSEVASPSATQMGTVRLVCSSDIVMYYF